MLSFVLALAVATPPHGRLNYEKKCLYCHSEEVTESKRFTEPQWKRLIEQMRSKAPLLITRSDVASITRYMTQTLKLVIPTRPAPVEVKPQLPVVPEPKPAPPPPVEEFDPAEIELEHQAFDLMQRRCSKCHSLGRVYGRLDTLERSLSTLERMRLKTGSGITNYEMTLLQNYLRTQF